MSVTEAFAALHHGSHPFVLPNAWDVASAVLLADAGFPAIGTTSLGVTAAAGLPDGAGAGRDLTIALAGTLVQRLSVPLTVDLEGGYSDEPSAVAALAAELSDLGVAGINLEDGGPDATLRPSDQHAAAIDAVVAAAPSLFVNARTDVHWLDIGPAPERHRETIRRLTAYRDAGASGVFVPGLSDDEQTRAVVDAIALPLNVLWRPDAYRSAVDAAGVARISTGSALYRHAQAAALSAADAARAGRPPPHRSIDYAVVQHQLRKGAARK